MFDGFAGAVGEVGFGGAQGLVGAGEVPGEDEVLGGAADGDDDVVGVIGVLDDGAGGGGEGVGDVVEAAFVVAELDADFLDGEGEEE